MANLAYHKFKRFLYVGALLFALLSPLSAFAQDDFFPPPGIFIPCCSSGGTGGHTGATYGENGQSAWKQVWGAAPGDVVTFRFILRARSAGSLHAWPKTTAGTEPEYLGDPNNQYEKWYWNTGQRSSGGTFCIDCPWQFTANAYNPWIYVDYWDSGDGWDVDLNVVNIQTPSRKPLVDQYTKDRNQAYANAATVYRDAFSVASGIAGNTGQRNLAFVFAMMTLVTHHIKDHFQHIANDPWDGEYGSPYEFYINGYLFNEISWICPEIQDGELSWICYGLMDALLTVEGLTRSTAVSLDRAQSCYDVGADCGGWQRDRAISYFHNAGDWLAHLGNLHWNLGQWMINNGINTDNDIVGVLWWAMNVYHDAAGDFWRVQ